MREKLEKHLFGEHQRVYAVLDGASIENLPLKLYQMQPKNFCLYRGELDTDLAEVAPYLVELAPRTEFTNWLLAEGVGKHYGIFAHSPFNIVEIRKHFRKFLTVYDAAGNPLLFRFYDPRVLTKFLPTCTEEELANLFGRIMTFFAEAGDANALFRYQFFNDKMQKSVLEINEIETSETVGV